MKRKTISITIILTLILLFGCARVNLVTSYYLLDYRPIPNNPVLVLDAPIPHKAQVINFDIPRS
ncbi:MAG: hypothetical protein P9M15_02375, partial [Candidatus Electryoneaceae bacterium]|nr:hypothetical protein [Candidatus Electryoneaceae bacterium]